MSLTVPSWQHSRLQISSKSTITFCVILLTTKTNNTHTHTHNHFTALFWDHPGEPVPEENLWTLWCKGRLTEADTPTIWLGATPSGLTSTHLHHPPIFLQAGCPSCHPTNSAKALKATTKQTNRKNYVTGERRKIGQSGLAVEGRHLRCSFSHQIIEQNATLSTQHLNIGN